MNTKPECRFFIRIKAPNGLSGIQDHLSQCELNLEAWESGYSGKVILRSRWDEERFEWDMDSSDTDIMVAHGRMFLTADRAWQLLQSLSNVLSAAHFPHEIAMDDEQGNKTYSCSHMWD
jgi:hypothetical protein